MTHMLVLLAPVLIFAEPVPKANETTLDKKEQVAVFGGDCRVKRTRAEVLLDIDPNPPGTAGQMKVRTRLILTPFTAKRVQGALQRTMQRYEATYGIVEVPKTKQPKEKDILGPDLEVIYANYCRVTATAEEIFLDFGLNENPFVEKPKVTWERKVILTPLGSKVLVAGLTKALTDYEAEHGVIELDVQKRPKKKP